MSRCPDGLRKRRSGLGRRSQKASWMISTLNMRSRAEAAISGLGLGGGAHAGAAGVRDAKALVEPLEEGRQEVEHPALPGARGSPDRAGLTTRIGSREKLGKVFILGAWIAVLLDACRPGNGPCCCEPDLQIVSPDINGRQ